MSTADQLRRLADLVERIEAEGATVREITPGDDGEGLVAEVTLELPRDGPTGDGATGEGEQSATGDTGATGPAPGATGPGATGARAASRAALGTPTEGPDDETAGDVAASETAAGDPADPTERDAEPSEGGATASAAEAAVPEADTPDAVPCRHPDCEETFDSRHGMRVHAAKVHREDDGDAAPVYTDPDALREAYDRCDTFAEMTDFLDVAVTPATVRRHMVDHGIHEPSSRNGPDLADVDADLPADDGEADEGTADDAPTSAADAATEDGPVPEADAANGTEGSAAADGTGADAADAAVGSGAESLPEPGEDLSVTLDAVADRVDESVDLPEGVTLAAVVEAVETGRTLHDVTDALDLERDRTRALLSALGLADLVTGRLSERPAEEETATQIDARLRRFADEGAEEAH